MFKVSFLVAFLALLCTSAARPQSINSTALAGESPTSSSEPALAGDMDEAEKRFYAFSTKYGNFCGAGNTQWSAKGGKRICGYSPTLKKRMCGRPIDDLDKACFYHDLCHEGNSVGTGSNCDCAVDFGSRLLDISENKCWYGAWLSYYCRFNNNAMAYAAVLQTSVC